LHKIDFKDKETIQKPQGQELVRQLNRIVEGIEKDNEYTAVGNRLSMKPVRNYYGVVPYYTMLYSTSALVTSSRNLELPQLRAVFNSIHLLNI